jgi:cyanophycinase
VLGGSSAGAAIMSRVMFAEARTPLDTLKYGFRKGEVEAGLGFIGGGWFIDQHFLTRGRFARALKLMHQFHFRYGVGVDEDTAVVYQGGGFEVVGYKGALVLDVAGAAVDRGLAGFNMRRARLTYLDAGDRLDCRTGKVTVSARKLRGRKVDPRAKGFIPEFTEPEDLIFPDMLGVWAVYEAMSHALDSRAGEVKGLALNPWDGGPLKGLGFEFRVYRGADTVGWSTSKGGNDSYTVLNAYVDITPVRLAYPLYTPLGPARSRHVPAGRGLTPPMKLSSKVP